MSEGLAEAVAQLQTNCTSCTAAFIQMAGVEALDRAAGGRGRLCG